MFIASVRSKYETVLKINEIFIWIQSQKALAEKAKKDKERAEQAQKEKLRLEAEKAKKEKERAEADKAAKERLKLQAEKVANERAHRAFNGMRGGEALPNQVQSLGDVLNPPAAKKATTGRR